MPARSAFVNANGAKWRLRSLIAMGHSPARISAAMGQHPKAVERVISGRSRFISPVFHEAALFIWEAWWDKTPPRRNRSERYMSNAAIKRAAVSNWPCAAGLDEDELDADPLYRPVSGWRPARGTGVASDVAPAWIRAAGRAEQLEAESA